MRWMEEALSPAEFARERLGLKLDARQAALLDGMGNRVVLNCTRQWGKSTVAAAMAVHRAVTRKDSLILVVGPVKRPAVEFLAKARGFVAQLGLPVKGAPGHQPSLMLPNGSRILGLPGKTDNNRGFSRVSLLVVDEAAFMTDEQYFAVKPAIAVGGGDLWMMSTSGAREGFFYEQCMEEDPEWTKLRVTAPECPWISQKVLDEDRKRMGEKKFAREYLCRFGDAEGALFCGETVERAVKAEVRRMTPGIVSYEARPTNIPLGRGEKRRFVVPVDLGMKHTPSAIGAMEAMERKVDFDRVKFADVMKTFLQLRWMEKVALETPYSEVMRKVRELAGSPLLNGRCDVVVDGTGVGTTVVEELRRSKPGGRVIKVTITGGDSAHNDGLDWWVPRKDLLHALMGVLEREELEIARELPETAALVKELNGMKVNGKKGESDDLVMTLALGVWWSRVGLGWL